MIKIKKRISKITVQSDSAIELGKNAGPTWKHDGPKHKVEN